MSQTEDAERLQLRMQRIRRRLDTDVDELLTEAQQLLDWRYYLLRHPISSLVGIAAAGYFLVPRKRKSEIKKIYLDPEASRFLAQQNASVVSEELKEEIPKQSLIISLGALALNSLVRAGMTYFAQTWRDSLMKDFLPPSAASKGGK